MKGPLLYITSHCCSFCFAGNLVVLRERNSFVSILWCFLVFTIVWECGIVLTNFLCFVLAPFTPLGQSTQLSVPAAKEHSCIVYKVSVTYTLKTTQCFSIQYKWNLELGKMLSRNWRNFVFSISFWILLSCCCILFYDLPLVWWRHVFCWKAPLHSISSLPFTLLPSLSSFH